LVKSLHFEQQRTKKGDNQEHPEEPLQRRNLGQDIEVDDLITPQRVSDIEGHHQNQAVKDLIQLL
jgi:hypothetical protein